MTLREKLFYRLIWQTGAKQLFQGTLPVRGIGLENIPSKGNYLVISNHRCWLDPVFISFVVRRTIQWAGIDFHFKIPVVNRFAKASGILPLPVEGGRRSRKALKVAASILKKERDALVGIFPEGASNFLNPSQDKIIRFHTGFARIALDAKVNIIPIAIKGYGEEELIQVPGSLVRFFTPLEAFRKGVHLLMYKEAVVHVGSLLTLDNDFQKPCDKDLLYEISRRARETVLKLYQQI